MQLTHYNSKFTERIFPITLICDNVTNAPNIGSLFRTSDTFGIEKLVLCGSKMVLGRKMTKTSRSTEKSVPYEIKENSISLINQLKASGYQIICLEITSESQPLHSFQFNVNTPLALVIGDENFGVSDEILKISDTIIHIDMFGQNSSMNVVQAANIVLYEITRQFL